MHANSRKAFVTRSFLLDYSLDKNAMHANSRKAFVTPAFYRELNLFILCYARKQPKGICDQQAFSPISFICWHAMHANSRKAFVTIASARIPTVGKYAMHANSRKAFVTRRLPLRRTTRRPMLCTQTAERHL